LTRRRYFGDRCTRVGNCCRRDFPHAVDLVAGLWDLRGSYHHPLPPPETGGGVRTSPCPLLFQEGRGGVITSSQIPTILPPARLTRKIRRGGFKKGNHE